MRIGIIGAGIFGLASTLTLRGRGHEVCLFEQGTIPCERASSTDLSKIIRRTNYDGAYLELVERAAEQWQAWHHQLSGAIYYQTGKLDILQSFTKDDRHYQSWQLLGERESGLQLLTPAEAGHRFPALSLQPTDTVLFDPWAGYLRSGQALEDLAGLAKSQGIQLLEETPVEAIDEEGGEVVVSTRESKQRFDRAILAAGPWIARLCPSIGQVLRISRQQMAFFKPADPAPFIAHAFPVWSAPSASEDWYGFPFLHEGLVKIADDRKGPTVDPDTDREATPDFLATAQRFASERIPALADAQLLGGRSCFYTNTPDNGFVVDWISERILVAGCGSGHGFKFGGSIGPVVADTLEDKNNPLGDVLRIDQRFDNPHI